MRGLRMTQAQAEAHQRRIGRSSSAISPRPRQHPLITITGHSGRFNYELELFKQIRLAGLPLPLPHYPFAKPQRRFKADWAYPDLCLLIEIDGQVHRIRDKWERDLERDQWIFFSEWRKLRVSPAQVRSGEALELVRKALAREP